MLEQQQRNAGRCVRWKRLWVKALAYCWLIPAYYWLILLPCLL